MSATADRVRSVTVRAVVWSGIALALIPLLPLVIWATAGVWRYPALMPQRFTARGFRALTDPGGEILHAAGLSAVIAVAVAVLACVIGFPAGRAVGLYSFRGRRAVQFLLLSPVIVPGIAATLGLQVFFIRFGLADSVIGVILVQLMPTVPYAATVLAGAFANLETDYERQARALGAGLLRTLIFVTVPLLRPALVTAGLFTFLISWSEYLLTLIVGGGQVQTLPLLLFGAIGSSDTTLAAALGVIVIAPAFLVVAVAARTISGRSDAVVGFGRW